MKNVYEVKYEVLLTYPPRKQSSWSRNNEAMYVVANGTVENAVRKAKRHLLKQRPRFTNDEGEACVEVTKKVKITSCERVMSDVVV